jgi:hypothetical protein
VDPSGGCDRALARGGNVSSMGDNSDIDCASCVESAADKKATAASNAAWRTYSSFFNKKKRYKKKGFKIITSILS